MIFILVSLLLAHSARALEPDQIALIVNDNIPESRKLAEYYARMRHIPDNRILGLKLPASEEIAFDRYEQDIVPTVRQFLKSHNLEPRAKCLVTFYGIPIRISPKAATPEEKQELADLQKDLDQVLVQIEPGVTNAEKLAKQLDESFTPVNQGKELELLGKRADDAIRAIGTSLTFEMDPTRRRETLGQLLTIVEQLAGQTAMIERFPENFLEQAPAQDRERWKTLRAQLDQIKYDFNTLQDRRFDAAARLKLRELVREQLGLFNYARLLQGQVEYLTTDGSAAAFDNELALLWWNYYPRTKWQANPLHYRFMHLPTPPVMMVMRLDGPQAGTARDIINASLKAERDGLKGKIVLDSRGIAALEKDGKPNGYGQYDETIRNLAEIVKTKTKLQMLFDEKPDVLPAGSVEDVALYCGWYSLRRYIPSVKLVPGAVGFHIASLEMVSLKADNEGGWVHGLLNDGIASTLGAVAEPYLHSFPIADDFFPLLMTGKLTLAEVYWRTTPLTSWMISVIGDPLYTPYKVNPAIKVEDLPPRMQTIFAEPATQPATLPTATQPQS